LHLGDVLRGTSQSDRAGQPDCALSVLIPAGTHGFEIIRRVLLREALLNELADERVLRTAPGSLTVAMVDLVGSTSYLKRSGARRA
jgi:hypothetical protein